MRSRQEMRPQTGRCAVSPAEYMDPERFPLTTLNGLPPRWQLLHDARNLHWLNAAAEGGAELSGTQERRLKELRDKAAAHPPLAEQAAALGEGREGKATLPSAR